MDRRLNPATNVPTVAAVATAFVASLIDWATSAVPASVPPEVVVSGQTLLTVLLAVAIGKLAQHFTWARDTVDQILDADAVIRAAEADG